MKNLYLIGAGGHCRSCIDVIETEKKYVIRGLFDRPENKGQSVMGYAILGDDHDLEKYIKPDNFFLITIGQIKSNEPRKNIFLKLKSLGAQFAIVISPRAHLAKNSKVSAGTIVMHDALINTNAVIHENCIINTKALVEHDAVVGAHSHIATGAIVNGDCQVGEGSFVGSGSVLKQGLKLNANSFVQAGGFFNGK